MTDPKATWVCPRCGHTVKMTFAQIAEVGTPYCTPCMQGGDDEPEMELVEE